MCGSSFYVCPTLSEHGPAGAGRASSNLSCESRWFERQPSTSTLYASIGFKFHVTATEQLEQYIIPGIVGRPACPLAGARAAPERTAMQHKKPFHGRDPPLSARCAAAQTPGGLMSPGFKFCSNFTLAADPPSRSSHPCVRDVLSKLAMA